MSPPRITKAALAALALATLGAQASAQHMHGPYAGLQARHVKTLSDEQLADLTAGRGMGLALAAELNGYPGPIHALDLADALQLTETQRVTIRQQFEAMQAEAIPLGRKLVDAETDLNRQFAERTITPERLKTATASIAEISGELRNIHLKFHLSTAAVLNAEQIRRCAELRGYTGGGAAAPGAHSGAMHHGTPMHGGAGHQQHMPGSKH
jgi:hypothetical protein